MRKLILIAVSMLPAEILAHHSRAEFGGDPVEVEGELVAISWRNPHPSFRLQLLGGNREVLEVQLFGDIRTLTETGVEPSIFEVGERIRLSGVRSSRRQNLLLATHALLSSGLEVVLQYNAEPLWSDTHVGGLGAVVADETILTLAAGANRGIFRVWSPPSTAEAMEAMFAMNPVFTEVALAARAGWDILDNPITRCEPSWMPFVMSRPYPREFIDHGDRLTLNIGYFDSSRTIYLGSAPAEIELAPSRMGLSIGRWEGSALVVETTGIEAPAYDNQGTLQSVEMRVIERFTLSEDQARLDYEATMIDPVVLAGPVVFRFQYLAREQALDVLDYSPGMGPDGR